MYFFQSCIILSFFAVFSNAYLPKNIKVENTNSNPIVVTVGNRQYTVASNEYKTVVDTERKWSGTFSAVPANATATNEPRTIVELSVNINGNGNGDTYSVSLVEGFNMGAKIKATTLYNCKEASCTADILTACPSANAVRDSQGEVVACKNSPSVMSQLCPYAVINESTLNNVRKCDGAMGYIITFN